MNKDELKLNLLFYLEEEFDAPHKELISNFTNNISNFLNNSSEDITEKIIDDYFKIIKIIIYKKFEVVSNLNALNFSLIESLFINFFWTDVRLFQNINTLYNNIYDISSKSYQSLNILFLTDFIKNDIHTSLGLDILLKERKIKKEYESELFKLEDEVMKLSKAREKILTSIGGKDNIEIKKYITQSTKLEQEIPHISEYNFKRKKGHTITPKERDNLIRLEKEIEDDNEWRETILSHFIKQYPESVQNIRKINKAIYSILEKEGEVLYHINEKEKIISDLKNRIANIDSEKFKETVDISIRNIKDIISEYFVAPILPLNANKIISIEKVNLSINNIYDKDEKFARYLEIKKRKPYILLLPFKVEPTYNADRNLIILPIYEDKESNIYMGIAKLKWEADTRSDVKASFYNLNSNKGINQSLIEKRFIDNFVLFFTDKTRFNKTVKQDIKDFFSKMFK